ncbi:MAG: FAD-binding oxidoreductase, partial [Humibacter sp.]
MALVENEIDETEEVVLAEVAASGPGHIVTIREVIVETQDARSIVFDIPAASAEAFAYRPGQFLTLRVVLPDGSAVARCYSLSSTPGLDTAPKITVKRIAGGTASGWLCENLEA